MGRRGKHPIVYVFIDSQNLNLGTSNDIYRNKKLIYKGWKLDFRKFRRYLSDKFHVNKAFLFIGYVDAELVLYSAVIEYPNYDKAIVVSGDGDFRCLYEFLVKCNKLLRIIIPNEKSESSLLRPFQRYKTFLIFDKEKLKLELNKNGRRRA